MKVKICGITNVRDALWAVNLGTDYIGLNFCLQSPRKVSPMKAMEIVSQLPPFVQVMGIFVDEPIPSIRKTMRKAGLKAVQLHGHESPEDCAALKAHGLAVWKVIHPRGPLQLEEWQNYTSVVDGYFFDTAAETTAGGTGQTFDWSWVSNGGGLGKPWFLAGGLTPDNVTQAIAQAHPTGVDVCSGVERSPTRKDFEAMKKFVLAAKGLD